MSKRDKYDPVVYCIENINNNKKYIGSTTRYKERMRIHRSMLKRNIHYSKHLQSSYNKNGLDSFKFYILENITYHKDVSLGFLKEVIEEREQYYIEHFKSNNRKFGYNSRIDCTTCLGHRWTEESKRAFSEKKKGIKFSDEHMAAIKRAAAKRVGVKRPEMSEWHKNLDQSIKKEIYNKAVDSRAKTRKEKLERLGVDKDPDRSAKSKIVNKELGISRQVTCYTFDFQKYKTFDSISECLEFLKEKRGNTSVIKFAIDKKYIYKNFLFKYGNNEITEKEKLEFIESIKNLKTKYIYKITNLETGEIIIKNNKKESLKFVGSKDKYFNTNYSIDNYLIEKFGPVIGDSNRKLGEFRESPEKDNSELRHGLNVYAKCND